MPSMKRLDLEILEKLYETRMVHDFPKNELRPYRSFQQLTKENHYVSYGYIDDAGEILAYACFAVLPKEKAVLLDYYAVDKRQRGTGIGSAFIRQFREAMAPVADHMLLEVESVNTAKDDADAEMRRHRIRFYEKNHSHLTGVRSRLMGVEFNVMCTPFTERRMSDARIQEELQKFYRFILAPILKAGETSDQYIDIWISGGEQLGDQ